MQGRPRRYLRSTARAVPAPRRRDSSEATMSPRDFSRCAPDGQHCARCNGTHYPYPGCRFVTALTWPTDEDDDDADEWQV
jgi:hypothetical protein